MPTTAIHTDGSMSSARPRRNSASTSRRSRTTASAPSGRTSRHPSSSCRRSPRRPPKLELVTTIFVLPLYHPLDIAESVASLDQLSHGRVIFGVGTGYRRYEADAVGVRFDKRVSRMTESIEVALHRAWTKPSMSFAASTSRSTTSRWYRAASTLRATDMDRRSKKSRSSGPRALPTVGSLPTSRRSTRSGRGRSLSESASRWQGGRRRSVSNAIRRFRRARRRPRGVARPQCALGELLPRARRAVARLARHCATDIRRRSAASSDRGHARRLHRGVATMPRHDRV